MEDLLIRPTTPQCAPIGSQPAPGASVAGPSESRNRGGCFSRAQKLAPMRLYLETKTAATITMPKSTWRGEKQPDRSPLPCRDDGVLSQGRPTAPYARSTSVAPSDVRPSLGNHRLTIANACSHSRTAARSAPVPLPAPVASVAGPSESRNRGGCFSRAQILGSKRAECGTNTTATIAMQKSTWRSYRGARNNLTGGRCLAAMTGYCRRDIERTATPGPRPWRPPTCGPRSATSG